jgi:glutamate 5-kinase
MFNVNSYNRIVIKIGSAVLATNNGKVNHNVLTSISEDIAWLFKKNKEVLIVSSGAIALGRKKIKFSENLSLAESQALAAHGQIELMSAWKKHLNKFSIPISQILLTPRDTELKLSSKNAQQTVNKLLEVGCLPIINENDTTATDEIKFGDNDLLASKVAKLIGADLLIILSTVDGLYNSEKDMQTRKRGSLIKEVGKITPKIKMMAGHASQMGKGGMISKIDAAEICLKNKCAMVIASGKNKKPIRNISTRTKQTWFIKK